MTDLSNFIRFEENGKLTGNVASIAYDINFTGERLASENPDAPVFRLFAKSPLGRPVDIGAIWQKYSTAKGRDYYSVSINTGHSVIKANLGRYPEQDDPDLMAIIPWS